jgi:hypothetical protein
VGPRAVLDAAVKAKIFLRFPYREPNPGLPVRRLVTILTELLQIKIAFTKKLRAVTVPGMPATIQFIIFCLYFSCLNT